METDTIVRVLQQVPPAEGFGGGFTSFLEMYLNAQFFALAFFVVLVVQVIKELGSKTVCWPDPVNPLDPDINVKVVQIPEVWLKLIVVGVTLLGMVLLQLKSGLPIISKVTAFDALLTFMFVVVIYFLGGKHLAQWLVNVVMKALSATGVIPDGDNVITEEQYVKLKKRREL